MNVIPLSEYPRPQLKRDSFMCLNGLWKLSFLENNGKTKSYNIVVPFSPESVASGVGRTLKNNETMCYTKDVRFNEIIDFEKERLLLHFGAVDYSCQVFIDGELTANHTGGYLPFTVEVNKSEFHLDVMVNNPYESSENSYPVQSGIWQTVWLEKVPKNYIKNIIIKPDLKGFEIVVVSNTGEEHPCTLSFGLKKYEITSDTICRIDIPTPQLWTPESPSLYYFSVKMEEDKVFTYTGLRTFEVKNQKLYLNGKPYFNFGVINYGYYNGSLCTPVDDKEMTSDITLAKKLGFNTIRLSGKVESQRWYYHCDSLGMLVWQDIVCGKQSGFQEEEIYQTVQSLYNVVSIGMWMVFNVGNGSGNCRKIAEKIAEFDSTRTINRHAGLFKHDGEIFRNYQTENRKFVLKEDKYKRVPVLISFGHLNLDLKKNNVDEKIKTKGDLTSEIEKIVMEQIIPAKQKGLAAAIFHQLTDVEKDTTGLITYDRQEEKVVASDISNLSDELLRT